MIRRPGARGTAGAPGSREAGSVRQDIAGALPARTTGDIVEVGRSRCEQRYRERRNPAGPTAHTGRIMATTTRLSLAHEAYRAALYAARADSTRQTWARLLRAARNLREACAEAERREARQLRRRR